MSLKNHYGFCNRRKEKIQKSFRDEISSVVCGIWTNVISHYTFCNILGFRRCSNWKASTERQVWSGCFWPWASVRWTEDKIRPRKRRSCSGNAGFTFETNSISQRGRKTEEERARAGILSNLPRTRSCSLTFLSRFVRSKYLYKM